MTGTQSGGDFALPPPCEPPSGQYNGLEGDFENPDPKLVTQKPQLLCHSILFI